VSRGTQPQNICPGKIKATAEEYYRSGAFYCSEAIVKTIKDAFNLPVPDAVVAMASGFPVGIGGSGCTCGAVVGGIIALGLFFGRSKSGDNKVNKAMELSRELHDLFKNRHKKLCCRVLTKGMTLGSPDHMNQCIALTGEVAEEAVKIILRELDAKRTSDKGRIMQNEKYNKLLAELERLEHVAIAFSGGVDSSFLLAAAREALGDNAVGITIDSPALPRYELEDAIEIARLVGARHIIVQSDEIEDEVKQNPVNRCYFCKKAEFGAIIEKAKSLGIRYVLDGSNADDLLDYRPGMNAIKELQVLSPLLDAGMTKADIREFSRALNLPTWDKPAYACLYSRIPYGQEIRLDDLEKVEKSENFFIDRGFKTIRVRCHGDLARIEVAAADRIKLLEEPLASEIAQTLKSVGFKYVALDIQGYRMGSFNESIETTPSKCGGKNHG
jgi:uncharacterized protein